MYLSIAFNLGSMQIADGIPPPGSTNIAGWKIHHEWVDVFHSENGDIPASSVSLPGGLKCLLHRHTATLHRFYGATEGNGALVNICRTGDDDNVAGAEMGRTSRAMAKRVHAWDMCEAKIEQQMQLVQLASGRSIYWRSLFMNCAMLHRFNIYNRATKENCIFRLWWEADSGSIFCAFNFASSGVQSCVSHNVTSWGKPAREIPERQLPFDSALGQKPPQRPEVIRATSGSFRERHFNVPESYRSRRPNWTTTFFRAETLTLELLEMGMFFFGHLTMYNRTQKLNIKIGFSLCHSRPR